MVTYFVAQAMTRGMVKSKLMHERKWVIRSQAPLPTWFYRGERSAVHRLKVGWRDDLRLRYSQTSPEKVQEN